MPPRALTKAFTARRHELAGNGGLPEQRILDRKPCAFLRSHEAVAPVDLLAMLTEEKARLSVQISRPKGYAMLYGNKKYSQVPGNDDSKAKNTEAVTVQVGGEADWHEGMFGTPNKCRQREDGKSLKNQRLILRIGGDGGNRKRGQAQAPYGFAAGFPGRG